VNKEQRRYYLESGDGYLCGMCRYQDVQRWGADDGGPEWEENCEHPLETVRENQCNMEPGTDCWGFSPKKLERRER